MSTPANGVAAANLVQKYGIQYQTKDGGEREIIGRLQGEDSKTIKLGKGFVVLSHLMMMVKQFMILQELLPWTITKSNGFFIHHMRVLMI